jgi:hypothetical protein
MPNGPEELMAGVLRDLAKAENFDVRKLHELLNDKKGDTTVHEVHDKNELIFPK